MTIQYASDLHLEFSQNRNFLKENPLQPGADVLLLAGDIVSFAVMHKHQDFFKSISDHFAITYWIPGNHEYYNSDIASKSGSLYEKIKDNVFLVNNKSVQHEEIQFIFSTLWSKIGTAHEWQIESELSDFHLIKHREEKFSTILFNQLHHESISFIEHGLNLKNAAKKVVVSHHAPTFFNYPEVYRNSVLNEAFAVELYGLIEDKGPDYWIYGHTHINTPDFTIGKTKLLTNQLGYVKYNEHGTFDHLKQFTI
jgi:predicted phosphohydrolase